MTAPCLTFSFFSLHTRSSMSFTLNYFQVFTLPHSPYSFVQLAREAFDELDSDHDSCLFHMEVVRLIKRFMPGKCGSVE